MVTDVLQKYNHCFVACVASMLCDTAPSRCNESIRLQEFIVSRFSNELQKGKGIDKEGVPLEIETDWGTRAMNSVVTKLLLANETRLLDGDPEFMFSHLRNGDFDFSKVLLLSIQLTQHCQRAVSATDRGLLVMNPASGKKEELTLGTFISHGMKPFVCDHSEYLSHVPSIGPFEYRTYSSSLPAL